MLKTPAFRRLVAGFLLLTGSALPAYAQPKRTPPTPAQMLDARLGPKFDDIAVTVPANDELEKCTVVSVPGQTANSSGWVLLDPRKQPLRRYFDSNGDDKVDVWSYYKDGVEVYREFDTTYKGLPNNFRWLNSGGMKWGVGGVDKGRGFINSWRMISSEEVAHEAFQAVARQDFARLQVLFLTDAEMQALKLPASKVKAVQANQQQAQKKFADLCKRLNLGGARFDLVEGAVPQCDTSTEVELIKFTSRAVRYELNKKMDFLHTQAMVQVGMTWRLVDVPSDTDPIGTSPAGGNNNPALEPLLQELADLDKVPPTPRNIGAKDDAVEKYYRKRIPLVQKIIPLDKAEHREGWYKQLFDNLSAMSQNSLDKATMGLLTQMKDDVVSKMPGTNLAAYGVYRDLWNGYAIQMALNPDAKQIQKIQDKWLEDLADFVKKYSRADDTPEALHQLAIGCEFGGKTEESKRWYRQIHETFPNHNLAPRAKGSEARLGLVGNKLELQAPLLADGSKTFDIAQLKGKIVIVHYWGSYSDQYKDDFVRLKRVMEAASKQNVELVCVNLDDNITKARDAVASAQAPGIHLFMSTNNATGLNSPLAVQYGIHILPTVFVVGRDGRVTNNTLQIGDIEAELRKIGN